MIVEFAMNSGAKTTINNPKMQYYPVKVAVNTHFLNKVNTQEMQRGFIIYVEIHCNYSKQNETIDAIR